MGPTLRILPFTIFVAFLALTVKIKDLFAVYPDALTGVKLFSNQAIAVEQSGANKTNLANSMGQNQTPNQAQNQAGGNNPSGGLTASLAAGGNNLLAAQNAKDAPNNLANLPRDPSHFTQSEIDLLQALAVRRDTLEAREKSLQQREITISAAEKRLSDKAAALEGMKAELLQLVNRRNQVDDERLRRLVKIYEAMKPREAAQILQKLDTDVAIGVLSLMKENKIAPIMGFMDPNRAQTLSVLLADRQISAPNPPSPASFPSSLPGGNTNGGLSLGSNNAMNFGANGAAGTAASPNGTQAGANSGGTGARTP